MFSGIIENTAKILKIEASHQKHFLEIQRSKMLKSIKISDSLCVNGICLTIAKLTSSKISFDILEETFCRTTLKTNCPGDILNIERPLQWKGRVGGHFVTGHIDGIGEISKIKRGKREQTWEVKFPLSLSSFIAIKGSISINGVSLTVGEVKGNMFKIHLIPFTLKNTNLGLKKEGEFLNLEVDLLARYAVSAALTKKSKITKSFLKKHDFLI